MEGGGGPREEERRERGGTQSPRNSERKSAVGRGWGWDVGGAERGRGLWDARPLWRDPGRERPRFAPPPDPAPAAPPAAPSRQLASSLRLAGKEAGCERLVVRGWLCEAAAPAKIALNTKEPFSRPCALPRLGLPDGRHWLLGC